MKELTRLAVLLDLESRSEWYRVRKELMTCNLEQSVVLCVPRDRELQKFAKWMAPVPVISIMPGLPTVWALVEAGNECDVDWVVDLRGAPRYLTSTVESMVSLLRSTVGTQRRSTIFDFVSASMGESGVAFSTADLLRTDRRVVSMLSTSDWLLAPGLSASAVPVEALRSNAVRSTFGVANDHIFTIELEKLGFAREQRRVYVYEANRGHSRRRHHIAPLGLTLTTSVPGLSRLDLTRHLLLPSSRGRQSRLSSVDRLAVRLRRLVAVGRALPTIAGISVSQSEPLDDVLNQLEAVHPHLAASVREMVQQFNS